MSLKEAIRRRDEAIEAVIQANSKWIAEAWTVLKSVCQKNETFSSDTVWAALVEKEIPPPREPRAMGGLLRQADAAGWCIPTESPRVRSARASCHARPLTVWRSSIYKSRPRKD